MKNSLIIVSGQPRSGTSLMMRILVESGIPGIYDEPGSYEYTPTITMTQEDKWVGELPNGVCIKMLWPHIGNLPFGQRKYKMIWMTRDPREQAKSQQRYKNASRAWMQGHVKHLKRFDRRVPHLLEKLGIEILRVSFDKLILNPDLSRIEAFLGAELDDGCILLRKRKANIFPIGELETSNITGGEIQAARSMRG